MNESDFKVVSYKRKKSQLRSKNIVNNNILSNESYFNVDVSFKRIVDAKLEITATDLYDSLLASLREGIESLKHPKISNIICLGLGKIGECLIARYQLAAILSLSDLYNVKISAYDPIFTEKDKELLSKFEVNVLSENLEGKFHLSGHETVLFYLPHCPKQLTNNLLWANWGLNLANCIIISNSFTNIIESNSSAHLVLNAYYISKIQPYVLELAIINSFKYYEIFNDTAIHVFPKLNYVCPDLWKDNPEPVYEIEA
ncbi:SRR1-like protein [Diorhabda carinulata]|uniref:SRR1-like protein n=1 Tax=Diorhabda carinulata TaxID=1163345 RepID=UPI00259FEC43|nr:SRR1-like protein [Diorhabda carinulata]